MTGWKHAEAIHLSRAKGKGVTYVGSYLSKVLNYWVLHLRGVLRIAV